MANEANTKTAEHAHHTPWQRLSPFLDVIGAVLIFGSWIFSNTLSQQAKDQANTHQSIISRVRAFRLYDGFARRVSDIQSDLLRTKNLVERASRGDRSLGGDGVSQSGALTWTGMTANQIHEINDFVIDLKRYAGQLTTSESVVDVVQSIENAQTAVGELSKAFESARDEYERLLEQRNMSTSVPNNDLPAREQEEALREHVDRLWQSYDEKKQAMLHVGDELLRSAAAESQSAKRRARQCKWLSYVFYIVGTSIVLYGRAKSVLSAKKKSEDS